MEKFDEKFVATLFTELKRSQEDATAILIQALCQQLDAAKLLHDLKSMTKAAESLPSFSRTAIDVLRYAQAGAEAEIQLQANRLSEGPHPKRGGC